MKITIGDLDYYYAKNKVNCFNTDVMKIASYHQQLGDQVNFVTKADDIYRPYDLYYIIKEKQKTPNPPTKFYLDSNVRWGGKAVKLRINGKMSDIMLGCKPDYLLYPEHNTRGEKAEKIRLFNNKAEPLNGIQDGTNTYKYKEVIITDPYIWCATKDNILAALDKIKDLARIVFLEPIGIQKIMYDEDLKNKFMQLDFKPGVKFNGSPVNLQQVDDAISFLQELKDLYPTIDTGTLTLDYRNKQISHGESRELALQDFEHIREITMKAKKLGIMLIIHMPSTRFETPYFELFEELANGSKYYFTTSGLEYISIKYGNCTRTTALEYGNHPEKGDPVFRDLLMQTYQFHDFIRLRGKDNYVSENEIPGKLGNEELKYGI